jgi:hypothetical protein
MSRVATVGLAAGVVVVMAIAACSSDESSGAAGAAGSAAGAAGTAGTAGQAGAAGSSGSAGAGLGGSAGAQACPGVAGAAGGLADAGLCAITTPMPACDQCINTKCLTECTACAQNPECKAAFNCVLDKCYLDGGMVMECAVSNCVSPCSPGALGDLIVFWRGTDDGCVSKNCKAECPE